jgi:peroxiredoxin
MAAIAVAGIAAYVGYFRIQPAPAVTFTSLAGHRVATADLRGKVVLVNFWATDCVVCLKEMPRLVETYRKFQAREFEVIAVAMRYDPPNYVIRYTEKNALPFRVALDPLGELAKAFGNVSLTPTTVVIDKRGNIVKRIVGEPDFGALDSLIERTLADLS